MLIIGDYMSSKIPPQPLVCQFCGEYFYGRKDAKTCSVNCRVKMKAKKDKEKGNG